MAASLAGGSDVLKEDGATGDTTIARPPGQNSGHDWRLRYPKSLTRRRMQPGPAKDLTIDITFAFTHL
jgi:hypothetical protein